ncbi:MAG: glucosidase [Simkania negevensis]|nr:glucosidase [Simkania negevensis]
MDAERKRLKEDSKQTSYWKRWGPYLAERSWGTLREAYGEAKSFWEAFPFDVAKSRCYRWGEDGIAGISDTHQRLCFALSFWNGVDPCLKERLFGLNNHEGNHGEDVKEYYYYLDNTPTHSYMKYLIKYPQSPFPYDLLRRENRARGKGEREYELLDTQVFDKDEYFDIFIEYAKGAPEDILIRITICNRGEKSALLHLLPTFWARNIWWQENKERNPSLKRGKGGKNFDLMVAKEPHLGNYFLYAEKGSELLFVENESRSEDSYGKEGIAEYLVGQKKGGISPDQKGTKGAFHYSLEIPPLGKKEVVLRLTQKGDFKNPFFKATELFEKRKKEADAFYASLLSDSLSLEHQNIARQAFAGMLWNKIYYHYVVPQWLDGTPSFHPPLLPHDRCTAPNATWLHVYNEDILSVPDKWEFPAFFSWDSAFHTLPLALLDPEFAKRQLVVMTREWYMHPSGQIPAYENNFSDVNPPVHAWATWRVYKIAKKLEGKGDDLFLERVFQKLLLNFTWWVNRKDAQGKNIFQGGFLGLDNISLINRSEELPPGALLYQSDATSWMGMYCLNMLTIACELAKKSPSYEDIANKFYNHFLLIADAINFSPGKFSSDKYALPLWDEEEGFYYDILKLANGEEKRLKVRSLVGLMPLLAVSTIDPKTLDALPNFKKKMLWFLSHRTDLCERVSCMRTPGIKGRKILALLSKEKLEKLLKIMLDEKEFLSPYGIRSLSQCHKEHPFQLDIDGKSYTIDYEPAESKTFMFGGNSNWRGPVWFPINMLIIESLQKFHHYYGDTFKVECPTGSGIFLTLWEVAAEVSRRLLSIFEKGKEGAVPLFGSSQRFSRDPYFKDYLFFSEYFHGETGEGLGASHQTGWTGCIAKLIKQLGDYGGCAS